MKDFNAWVSDMNMEVFSWWGPLFGSPYGRDYTGWGLFWGPLFMETLIYAFMRSAWFARTAERGLVASCLSRVHEGRYVLQRLFWCMKISG